MAIVMVVDCSSLRNILQLLRFIFTFFLYWKVPTWRFVRLGKKLVIFLFIYFYSCLNLYLETKHRTRA
ncbi:hypothetical protein B0T26DRAFT_685180 [Lasiosphaeria miniovina]|uniref:Uncharacterized protein n=1 Tax=Lasiosphaeria miniovina TaxID=1954250 RepID=A0AA40BG75_9PEZI|nr:uncharacterized protein B0T26DRAFT_685180 [Lasiosphaeria miniovina]KAK0733634.1 hypothetical protein B0T26DRAFT_685180 [Lasiosphaeria miniovina]